MRWKIVSSIILSAALLAGCGSQADAPKSASTQPEKVNNKNAENEYIQAVHESATKIDAATQKLREQLAIINVDDSGWSVTTRFAFDDLHLASTGYLSAESILSTTDAKEKYAKTIAEMDKGIEQIKAVYTDGQNAVDNFDKKKLEEISSQLDAANQQIKKGLDQLEVDRYAN